MANSFVNVRLDSVKIGEGRRTSLGDLDGLAKSLETVGLLHPIVLTPAKELVVGVRRLAAARQLGWKTIPAHVAGSLDDAVKAIQAETDENAVREPLSPADARTLQARLEAAFKPEAEQAQQEGRKRGAGKGGRTAGRGRRKASPTNNGKGNPNRHEHETKARAASATGYSPATLRKVEAIQKAATEDPEKFGDLAEKLKDPTCKVEPIYKEMKRRQEPAPELSRHLNSDLLVAWLKGINAGIGVFQEKGGIGAMLKEKKKWNWDDVREFILPMLKGLGKTLNEIRKEIEEQAG